MNVYLKELIFKHNYNNNIVLHKHWFIMKKIVITEWSSGYNQNKNVYKHTQNLSNYVYVSDRNKCFLERLSI